MSNLDILMQNKEINPNLVEEKNLVCLGVDLCNLSMQYVVVAIPRFNGPSGTINIPPERKKNGAILYNNADPIPISLPPNSFPRR